MDEHKHIFESENAEYQPYQFTVPVDISLWDYKYGEWSKLIAPHTHIYNLLTNNSLQGEHITKRKGCIIPLHRALHIRSNDAIYDIIRIIFVEECDSLEMYADIAFFDDTVDIYEGNPNKWIFSPRIVGSGKKAVFVTIDMYERGK